MRTSAFDVSAAAFLLPMLAGAAAIGCATSQGDKLMKEGAFVEAESAYGAELAANPGSADITRKRSAAREQAVRASLEHARAMRTSGHGEAALSILGEALRLEARWSLALPPDLGALRDQEIAGAAETAESVVRPLLVAKAPLGARRRADRLKPLLAGPRLAPVADRVNAEVTAAGGARCAELTASRGDQQPHLARAIASYCALLGAPSTAAPAPEQRRGLRLSGQLAGATEPQKAIVETWLAEVFQATPWFAAEAEGLVPLQMSGSYDARLERRRVTLNAPYHETVTSTLRQGLIDRGTLETEVDRTFQYEADEYLARYDLDTTLSLDLGEGPPLVVRVKHTDRKRAYQHDVSFPPANVHPEHAELPSVTAWLGRYLAGKKLPMIRKLRGRWVKAFCADKQPSPEQAARCVAGGERRRENAAALATVLGADADLVIDDITRDPAEQPKPDGKTPEPAVEETPTTGGETI